MRKNNTKLTIGIDLGDKIHSVCVLSHSGKVLETVSLLNNRNAVEAFFRLYTGATVILEAGAQSLWMSHLLKNLGLTVLVGNARRLRMIWDTERKFDKKDAEMLARIARFDPQLVCPIEHRRIEAQCDLNLIKARDIVVRTRTNLINFIKGVLKQFGLKGPSSCTADTFHKTIREVIPETLDPALSPTVEIIRELTTRIKQYDKQIDRLCEEKYKETQVLSRIRGVGNQTALAYTLTIGNPDRFTKSRDVGAYLGLVPRRDQSGETDKQLHITKSGNNSLRRLLVNCAQYILGPFGEDSDLRRYGERISARGGQNAKRRAVVAVARKLAVLMHALLRSGEIYQPLRKKPRSPCVTVTTG